MNLGLSYTGTKKGGAFDVPAETARLWLKAPTNANGLLNNTAVRPWRNGIQITRRAPEQWIVDFGEMTETDASYFSLPFGHVVLQRSGYRHAEGVGWSGSMH
jgi:hypothetical protein